MLFKITSEEKEKLDFWLCEHNKICVYYDDGIKPVSPAGAIGGVLTYTFTPTSIGTVIHVQCACGAGQDITNYKDW